MGYNGGVDDARLAWLTLALCPGLGARRVAALIECFGSPAAALRASRRELERTPGIGPAAARALTAATPERAERQLALAEESGVAVVARDAPDYPAALAAIHDPPAVLFVRGRLPVGLKAAGAVAVVGTRRASAFALRFARELAAELAAGGVVVVSGLALGVDGAAHRGACEHRGATVAVLGSGVDRVHPKTHGGLAERILERGGALLSEYPLGTPARPGHFPARNRIVSGLSAAVVVVEAGRGSGALITADFALEQGRAVLAVPNRPDLPSSQGALALLDQGAALARDAADVWRELGWRTDRGRGAGSPPPALPADLALVHGELARLGETPFDDLMLATGLEPADLGGRLTRLELLGVAERTASGRVRARPPATGSARGR